MRIIKSGLMSKTVYFNNYMLEMNGDKVEYFSNLINNAEIRNQEILKKNATLCGIIPTLRIINNIGTGISIDNQKNIVFHTKELNKKYNISELDNYELFIDNNATIEKRTKINKERRSRIRTFLRKLNDAIATGVVEDARKALEDLGKRSDDAISALDGYMSDLLAKTDELTTDDAILIYTIIQEESSISPENVKIIPLFSFIFQLLSLIYLFCFVQI